MPTPTARGLRRLRAEGHYVLHGLRVLARPLLGMAFVLIVGANVEYFFQDPGAAHKSWSYSFFVVYCLLFLEHIEATPEHPLAQLVHYGLPLVGILLVSEGVLRLGLDLLNREANARVWVGIMARTTKDHVIVCGLGSVGFRASEELLAMGVEVFAVEFDAQGAFLDRARQHGIHVVVGDARAERLLEELNVAGARAVVIATDNDLANMEIAMDVRDISRTVPIVLRLFDQRLADKVKGTLGVDVSVSTSRLAAPLFAASALDPSVVGTHRMGDVVLVVAEVALGEGHLLSGQTLGHLTSQGLTVIGFKDSDGGWEANPPGSRACARGDVIRVLLPAGRLGELHRLTAT